MQEQWQNFLKEQGATIEDNGAINFKISDIEITKTELASPLANFTILAISGNDRHTFLHGQFINDLNLIEKPGAQLSAWCNPKGQVITNFIIINTGISYLLLFKQDLKEFVQKRLSMFVMRSDVTIENITESSPIIGMANTKDLSALGENIPTNAGEVYAVDGLVIICHPDNSGRYLITGITEALTKKLPELHLTLTSSTSWELLDVLSGLPWITSATQEQFLPQMLNLDVLNGLSYQKGCYPGQEVIARLHYRGEVKKRLQLIKTDNELVVGDSVYLDNSENKIGTVINSARDPVGNYYGLAVIELEKESEKLISSDKEITLIELPYEIN
jgi:tRNA-modifying protein YgfZ